VKGVRAGNSAKFSADGLTVNGAQFTATDASSAQPKASKTDRTSAAKK
jgi:hypothetical protein